MSSSGMSIAEHIDELRIRMIHIVICIAIITIFSMSFGIKAAVLPIELPLLDAGGQQNNLMIFYPYPDPFGNVALQLTAFMKDTLLPPEVKLIQTAPGQVFFAQVHISLLIGLICSLPVVIREIFGFFSPAFDQVLSKRKTKDKGGAASGKQDSNDGIQNYEKSTAEQDKKIRSPFSKLNILKIILPIFLLFIFGVVFSYILVIPFTLNFLYKYGESIGAETFLTVNDFITFVLQFVLGFGIAFQLPVIMYALSLSGLTDSRFWQKNFRYAIIIITIFGAVITPDGSGVTMWFVALPMIALYAVGIFAIKRKEKDSNMITI
ncbi:MAG: twin-arginine translocase subunit TatC [Thermoproteota archaeon]|nr:twin-arginine translocase subunit TatC [Thermoproteota archaeon]